MWETGRFCHSQSFQNPLRKIRGFGLSWERFDTEKGVMQKVLIARTKVLDRRKRWCYYESNVFICQMRLSRKSSRNEGCRELPGGARQCRESDEVHSVSSVLNLAVGTTGATVTSLRLFRPCGLPPGCEVNKAYSAKNMRSRVVPRISLRPCIRYRDVLFLYFSPFFGR